MAVLSLTWFTPVPGGDGCHFAVIFIFVVIVILPVLLVLLIVDVSGGIRGAGLTFDPLGLLPLPLPLDVLECLDAVLDGAVHLVDVFLCSLGRESKQIVLLTNSCDFPFTGKSKRKIRFSS